MRLKIEPTEETRQYAEAYTAHYSARDLPLALKLYRQLLVSHPDSQAAVYAHMQLHNIANAVVPKQDLQDAQMKLLLAHFQRDGRLDAAQTPTTQLVAG